MCSSEQNTAQQEDRSGELATGKVSAGLHHLGLTVANVVETATFFTEHLNFDAVGEKPDYPAIFVSDGEILLTLWQAKDPATVIPFSRHDNVGLHHFALKVKNSEALDALYGKLQKVAGVQFEFAPEALGVTPIKHMMCTIPGGLRVEFVAAPTS